MRACAQWARTRRTDTKVTGTTSDIYNISRSRRTEAFISSSVVPQINRCREWKWQKGKEKKDFEWWHLESGIPVTKTGTQTGTSTHFQQTEIDTISFALSCMPTFVYAIEGTDGISYQQSFHVAVLLSLHVAVCSVWYLFHHLVISIRKHIAHSKWHPE